ncbi:MAG: HDIG domain-containing protein [Nostocales cyanobacterium]|nr:MAG: HDIG domain-containing protein [Nostocales cyanobacterium]TAF13975.1 MAG: HDIG domain-containing protein [Nostocales cyanobacterium]
MKTQRFLQSLTQQLRQWRRQYKVLCRKGKWLCAVNSPNSQILHRRLLRIIFRHLLLYLLPTTDNGGHQPARKPQQSNVKSLPRNRGIYAGVSNWLHRKRSVFIFCIAIVSLTGLMGHELYNQPQMQRGSIAPQTFIAPRTANIEDQEQTEIKRKAAQETSQPVLMISTQKNEQIQANLQKILEDAGEVRTIAGSLPFFDVSILAIDNQKYLRSCVDAEWEKMKTLLSEYRANHQLNSQSKDKQRLSRSLNRQLFSLSESTNSGINNNINTPQFDQALAELQAYSLTTSNDNFSLLINQIYQVRKGYKQAAKKLFNIKNEISLEVLDPVFLNLSDQDWVKTQIGINKSAERMLTQGIPPGLPSNILKDAANLQVQISVPAEAEAFANKVLLAVLAPNLQKDEEQTQIKAQMMADNVPAVMREVKQGEVIVKKGEIITSWDFDVLEHYEFISREVNWLQLTFLGGLVSVGVGVFVWVDRRLGSPLRQRDRLLILLLTLSIPSILVTGVPYTTWIATGLLLGSFYGPILGITVVSLLSIIIPITLEISKIALIAGATGGILSSYLAQRFKSREELALLGIIIALIQGGIYLILNVLIGAAFGSAWYIVLQDSLLFGLSGLVWSVTALGLSPYLEKLFDLITPIRLAELANPNRPLLKRLATETPGTFQHTLFVATLAEAAAKKLRCNVELVRAGTLYHDIGKMHDPLGFIENQMGGPNKHDTEIKNPWHSAEIIRKHVTEGLVMARKHSLPTAIQAFIPEHQGTMAIAYFYHQAQQMAKEDPSIIVNKADFCYEGPIPQSRETGIVMLADSCEAALRSLKDATPEQALNMLNNIIRAKWQEQQLVDSGLTKEEMPKIAHIFVEVWQQFHHKRIAYPK